MPHALPVDREQMVPVGQARLVLIQGEVALAGPTHGAEPGVGNRLERRPRGDAPVGIAFLGVVDVAAGLADPALEGLRRAHPMAVSQSFLMRRRVSTGRVSRCQLPQMARSDPERPTTRGRLWLLVRRTPKARFMGGVWVFPGGAVDAGEGAGDEAHRAAAVRELQEEAGIELE